MAGYRTLAPQDSTWSLDTANSSRQSITGTAGQTKPAMQYSPGMQWSVSSIPLRDKAPAIHLQCENIGTLMFHGHSFQQRSCFNNAGWAPAIADAAGCCHKYSALSEEMFWKTQHRRTTTTRVFSNQLWKKEKSTRLITKSVGYRELDCAAWANIYRLCWLVRAETVESFNTFTVQVRKCDQTLFT